MPLTPFLATDPKYRRFLHGAQWSLCVGAGICRGIMPDWAEVTRLMLERANGTSVTSDHIREIVASLGWSLDSLLQQALNSYLLDGRTADDFNGDLAEVLYGGLLARAQATGLKDALETFLTDPFRRNPALVLPLEEFLSREFGTTSVMQLARVLLKASDADCKPDAVLTFNADVLLHAATTLLQIRQAATAGVSLNPSFHYRGIHRASDRANRKTPIYHVHGSITPAAGFREARDRLIFPESSYVQLAGSVASWPQTIFSGAAQSSRMIFVGLSMSDANIRRWLGWANTTRIGELAQRGSPPKFSSQHLWITTPSHEPHLKAAKEAGLLHLGVRTAFVPSWDRLEDAISNLLGI